MKILGISCFYHDAAAALLVDGEIVAAAQEERFSRKKHDDSFPAHSIEYCLSSQKLSIGDIDYVVFYDKPVLKFERLLMTFIKVWPRGLRLFVTAMRVWLKEKLWVEHTIAKRLEYKGDILFTEHHYAHAASAYYASPFLDATVVTMDGVGEWDTATVGYARGNELKLTHTIHFPDSLGMLYSAVTYYLGFKVNSAEYKVMGLAPYGNPNRYYEHFKKLIDVKANGSFRLDMRYFAYEYGLTMTNTKFDALFGGQPRTPESELTERHKDIAASLQKITEEIVLKIVTHAKKLHPSENLCMAGGVALNAVANGKILASGVFKNIYIQPAAGDAGCALGAACYVYFDVLGHKKEGSAMKSAYLGPSFSNDEIKDFLGEAGREYPGFRYSVFSDSDLSSHVAKFLSENQVVGWFQGRMEFGPRALGNRSILADPRKKENWQRVNLKIKFRESFRPFAPSVLAERAGEYFDLHGAESSYMLLVAPVRMKSIPAVTHVDGSARIQTLRREDNERFYDLISEFEKLTGCSVLVNTSFNVRGEPIVCTPKEALRVFANTDMDVLVLGNFLIVKSENPMLNIKVNQELYLKEFQID